MPLFVEPIAIPDLSTPPAIIRAADAHAPLPDNAPENIYAQVLDSGGKVVATVYKKGIVATSGEISAKLADEFAKNDDPKARAEAIAKEVGGTVRIKE